EAHVLAFVRALGAAEAWLRLEKGDEIGVVFAEHCDSNKQLREVFYGVKPNAKRRIKAVEVLLQNKPLHHIIDTVYFSSKEEKWIPMLQRRDACAYEIGAGLAGQPGSDESLERTTTQMWMSADVFSWPAVKPKKAARPS